MNWSWVYTRVHVYYSIARPIAYAKCVLNDLHNSNQLIGRFKNRPYVIYHLAGFHLQHKSEKSQSKAFFIRREGYTNLTETYAPVSKVPVMSKGYGISIISYYYYYHRTSHTYHDSCTHPGKYIIAVHEHTPYVHDDLNFITTLIN